MTLNLISIRLKLQPFTCFSARVQTIPSGELIQNWQLIKTNSTLAHTTFNLKILPKSLGLGAENRFRSLQGIQLLVNKSLSAILL